MIYLYWYLGIGVAVFVVISSANFLMEEKEKEKETASPYTQLGGNNPDREIHFDRIMEKVLVPILAVILFAAVWPFFVYTQVKGIFEKKAGVGVDDEREFSIEHQHLLERLTIEEVEKREVVTDPRKAAPELPFGHLNLAWKRFINGHCEGDELWSFSARRQSRWGRTELRSGYVMVRNGTPGADFLTVWKNLPEDADAGESDKRALERSPAS